VNRRDKGSIDVNNAVKLPIILGGIDTNTAFVPSVFNKMPQIPKIAITDWQCDNYNL